MKPTTDKLINALKADTNYLRFRISPDIAIALGACAAEGVGDNMTGEQVELAVSRRRHGTV